MKLRRSKVLHETVELNITAFLNLMVILVPFLLITAVFSRMTVLELTLPALSEAQQDAEQPIDLELQLVITPDSLDLRDGNLGRLKQFELQGDEVDWTEISEVLLDIKRRFPDETAISLLLDPSVPYSRLIEVMDHVRSTEVVNVTTLEAVELFPDVAIGKAPEESEIVEKSVETLDALEAGIQAAGDSK